MTTLFDPITLGDYTLKNRVIMAPMTRGRSGQSGVPTDVVAEYYAQRAEAGLIVTEATAISAQGDGWPGAPGLYTQAQIDGWRKVADAVHAKGGRIFAQIWHMGRGVLPDYADGAQPVSASPIRATGEIIGKDGQPTEFAIPRALTLEEIPQIVADFVQAARNAVAAGLDGVEIHAANNFLLDSFLRDGTNTRTDAYGGSMENRARLLIEVTEAVVNAIGAGRVGVRFSPTAQPFGIKDSAPSETFATAARLLNRFGLAYLHLLEMPTGVEHMMASDQPNAAPAIRAAYEGTLILNGGYDQPRAQATLDAGEAEAVAFGYPFIANPDLVTRMHHGFPLADADPATFYTPDAEGYTTYPAYNQLAAE